MSSTFNEQMQGIGDLEGAILEWPREGLEAIPEGIRLVLVEDTEPSAQPIDFENIRSAVWHASAVFVVSVKDGGPDLTPETYAELIRDTDAALQSGWVVVILTSPNRIGHWRGYLGFRGIDHTYYSRAGRLPLQWSRDDLALPTIFAEDMD
jgi:hypothetical protein